jgi:hypothetical protein
MGLLSQMKELAVFEANTAMRTMSVTGGIHPGSSAARRQADGSGTRKPGSITAGRGDKATTEAAEGARRRAAFLDTLAKRIKAGRIGQALESPKGMVGGTIAPFTQRAVDGGLRFELSPHFGIHDDCDDEMGDRQWQISS